MTDTNPTNHVKAALWMLGSVVSFTLMGVAARQINGYHDTFEIMAARSFVGLVVVLVVGASFGLFSQLSLTRLPGHVLRNVIHFTGQNLWLYAITLIPLAQVFALEFTSPIWVLLLSPFLLGEKLTLRRIITALIGFFGVLIVARPDFGNLNMGVVAASAAAIAFALTNISTKRLTRAESLFAILFWLTLLQFSFGAVLSAYDRHITWPTAQTAIWLVLIGLCGVVAHFSLTSALRLAPASFVMPFDFLRLPLIAVLAALLFQEAMDPLIFLGGAIIVLANLVNLRADTQKKA